MDTKNDNVQELPIATKTKANSKNKTTNEDTKKSTSTTNKKAAPKKTAVTAKDKSEKLENKKTTPKKKATTTKDKADDSTSKKSTVKTAEKKSTTTKKVSTVKPTDKAKAVGKTKKIDHSNAVEINVESKEANVVENKEIQAETLEKTSEALNSTTPVDENIKKFKLFFVSDMDEEAAYLHKKSLEGLHFVNKNGMQYFFKQGAPMNYFYHLGYHEKDKHNGTRYLDSYAEAGWENIYHEKAEFDGIWNYFRIEMPEGESEPNIFSDRTSRLSLYKRLLSAWRSLLAVDVICFLCMIFVYVFLSNHPGKMTGSVMSVCSILILLIILVFVIYLRAYLKISKKQEELQKI